MMGTEDGKSPTTVVGRYSIHAEIAHGGMATVHVGRLMGPVGFSRTVAVKRLHAQFAKDPEFVAMFMDEARLAARIRHPNVVSIIDVVAEQGELLLVMDYIQGESLSRLLRGVRRQGPGLAPPIAGKIITEVLGGLHAAHEARNERGNPLGIVHRDVSPQNILVGVDGVSHLIDFGVAKAVGRVQSTRDGQIKGKLAYMAPEQIRGGVVDRRTDVYAISAVLWEALVGQRLFKGDEANLMYAVLTVPIAPPSSINPKIPEALDAVVRKGLQKKPENRYATALEMADALEAAVTPASSREVARWMRGLAAEALNGRAGLVAEIESISHVSVPPPSALLDDLHSDVSSTSGIARAHDADASDISAPGGPTAAAQHLAADPTTELASSISGSAIEDKPRAGPWRWVVIAAGVAVLVAGTWVLARQTAKPTSAMQSPSPSVEPTPAAPTPVASVRPTESSVPLASAPVPLASSSAPTVSAPIVKPSEPTVPAVAAPPPPRKRPKYTRD